MLTAAVAQKRLRPAIFDEARRLLAVAASAYPSSSTFIGSSVWADNIKRIPNLYTFNNWHFVDFPYADGVAACSHFKIDPENITYALSTQFETLRSLTSGPWARAFALRMVVHLVGDIHEPMHCITRCSQEHPKGDLGGNLFKLEDPTGSHLSNLHKFWDAMGGQYVNTIAKLCPYGDWDFCESHENEREMEVAKEAERIVAEWPISSFSTYNEEETIPDVRLFMEWGRASFDIAKAKAYADIKEGFAPSKNYTNFVQQYTRGRVALGGYRLAALLNANLAVAHAPNNGEKHTATASSVVPPGAVAAIALLALSSVALVFAVIFLLYRKHSKSSAPAPFQSL